MIQETVLSGGVVRIPEEFMKKLKIQEGEKVIFTEDPKGNIILANSSLDILPTLECGFWDLGPKLGLSDEHDIVRFVNEFRKGRKS
ncbi:MAG: AbrB/MazE/SpoVT family DNA-binding domain-containing protein [Oscillospiraceae bacterium]|jgi:bifunctional DNA-binding transcriptional regulator/antitoxin component of YhaV-PrlF toxin-antitoxin module|nr:AbrB/MazE/SpoVT family DNA-binding domain-containing protein [Oscillospiraceae bacterium]MBQ4000525.1 AbrB/MazE/SpoVT family DNA-binding domain-containing protein [Oscillospiraceae bacterium]MBQ4239854.1 AbrB/MazE/SpoVT family DNA-binding domain-containing protein [Oscillospiraceae bacterium]MBQ5412016.1 AbrB/MazE/SpoVT family DNA-binding domain-containing protein [Oscillospiraceae bacterium]